MKPILLLFDDSLTHLSAATVELALAEIIFLVKLPAHCTRCFTINKGVMLQSTKSTL